MIDINDITKQLPEMLVGEDLVSALAVFPEYDATIVNENTAKRLMALSDIYKIYVPSRMSLEIYSKLYLALLRSLQKKGTKVTIQQRYENHKIMSRQEYTGLIGGSDSFTIIGASGIGKSSAISRAIHLITDNCIIEVAKPYTKIIPCVVVQCPFDSSVKGLLLEILRKVDECIGSTYYTDSLKIRATTDLLIGSVSQVALNHIGMLIVDEIQNVANSKNGKVIVGCLTQLINNSGISICMVGTPESTLFFEQAMQLARRSLGLQYGLMEYDIQFIELCKILFFYQYVQDRTEITDAMIQWLYEHSGGNVSIVVSLIHDAQEIAILTGKERVNFETLNEAYKKRLSLLHGYIQPTISKKKQTSTTRKTPAAIVNKSDEIIGERDCKISELVNKAKIEHLDIVQLLKKEIPIEVVAI